MNLVESGTKIPSFDLVVHILNELEMSADAALCDSLISATPIKASFLQSEVADLEMCIRDRVLVGAGRMPLACSALSLPLEGRGGTDSCGICWLCRDG